MFEYFIIAALVIWSAFIFFHKVAPNFAKKLYTSLANQLDKHGMPRLAKKIRPTQSTGGCSMGCGCSADQKKQPKQHKSTDIHSVKWK